MQSDLSDPDSFADNKYALFVLSGLAVVTTTAGYKIELFIDIRVLGEHMLHYVVDMVYIHIHYLELAAGQVAKILPQTYHLSLAARGF